MITIKIPPSEHWDSGKQEFINTPGFTLVLEHSLVSVSKWESKWCKVFLSKQEKTYEETMDYIECMTITQNVKPEVYKNLTKRNVDEINDYIGAPMTASTFPEDKSKKVNNERVTAETIYYWMISLNIPFECQKWHLNRLLALIKTCNNKNKPIDKSKANTAEIMNRNAAINAARKAKLGTKG